MKTKFIGLCIDGPRDGQTIESNTPFFRAMNYLEATYKVFDPSLEIAATPIVEYKYDEIHYYLGGKNESIGFWVLSNVGTDTKENTTYILKKLIAGYRKPLLIKGT